MATRVIDVITYNGERDLFDLRYNILKDYVDYFVVVEFPTTFSGKDKPLYFKEIKDKYDPKKVLYFYFSKTDNPGDKFVALFPGNELRSDFLTDYPADKEILALADSSPNVTKEAEHWRREFYQKESIKKVLKLIPINDEDVVFIGDCDEIWDRQVLLTNYDKPWKLKLEVYTYWLNNKSSEQFWGTLKSNYKYIKNACLNHLRSDSDKWNPISGWHFTSMGGPPAVRKKLTDSYTKESYATDYVLEKLEENIEGRKDFLGRNFTYKIDESEWPQYLKDNKHKYKHLIYEPS